MHATGGGVPDPFLLLCCIDSESLLARFTERFYVYDSENQDDFTELPIPPRTRTAAPSVRLIEEKTVSDTER